MISLKIWGVGLAFKVVADVVDHVLAIAAELLDVHVGAGGCSRWSYLWLLSAANWARGGARARGGAAFGGRAPALCSAPSSGALVSAPTDVVLYNWELPSAAGTLEGRARVSRHPLYDDSITAAERSWPLESRRCREQPSTPIDCNLIRAWLRFRLTSTLIGKFHSRVALNTRKLLSRALSHKLRTSFL